MRAVEIPTHTTHQPDPPPTLTPTAQFPSLPLQVSWTQHVVMSTKDVNGQTSLGVSSRSFDSQIDTDGALEPTPDAVTVPEAELDEFPTEVSIVRKIQYQV